MTSMASSSSSPLVEMTGSFIEELFDDVDLELIGIIESENYYVCDANDFGDCFLDGEDMRMLLTPPSVEMWRDLDPATNPAIFTIDDAKRKKLGTGKD